MVAEYWYKKPTSKTLFQVDDGTVVDDPKKIKKGKKQTNKRSVEGTKVCMRLMSGHEFLTDEVEWAGKYIPICPVIGEEIYIEGRVVRRGMVRDAKDPQRVYNYMRTAAVEAAALQPKAPFIVTIDQIKGVEKIWKTAGSKNHPYLPYNPDGRAPGAPQRSQPALASQGLDSQAQIAAADIQANIGIYNVSLGAQSNETSGKAINARNAQADTGTFNYIDNLGTAIQFAGRILVDLIPKIYDTPRIVRILKEDGSHDMVPINQQFQKTDKAGQPVLDPMGQAIMLMHDLSVGEYDVAVVTGPSFATRRQEAASNMTDLIRNAPKLMDIAGDLLVKNLDFPGADQIAARLEKTIPPQITGDGPPPGPPPPNPKDLADTARSVAQARLYNAQAEQAEIEAVGGGLQVIQMMQTMNANFMALKATIDALAQPGNGNPNAMQAPPQPMPPPAMPAPAANQTPPQLEELQPI
jgi:hypothetical protein